MKRIFTLLLAAVCLPHTLTAMQHYEHILTLTAALECNQGIIYSKTTEHVFTSLNSTLRLKGWESLPKTTRYYVEAEIIAASDIHGITIAYSVKSDDDTSPLFSSTLHLDVLKTCHKPYRKILEVRNKTYNDSFELMIEFKKETRLLTT